MFCRRIISTDNVYPCTGLRISALNSENLNFDWTSKLVRNNPVCYSRKMVGFALLCSSLC